MSYIAFVTFKFMFVCFYQEPPAKKKKESDPSADKKKDEKVSESASKF